MNPRPRFALPVALALAVLGHALLFDRFGILLGDDVEALVHNLHLDWTTDYEQLWYANADWIPRFRAALRWGLAPISVLALTSGALRFADLVRPRVDPLPDLPARTKAAIRTLVGLPFLLAAFPLALGLSMWVAVEVHTWIEWTGHVEQTMADLYTVLPQVLLPGILVAGGLVLAATLAPRGSGFRKPLQFRRLRQLPGLIAITVVCAPLASAALVATPHAARIADLDGREHWAPTCGGCHERALPLYFVKSPDEWGVTVRTHREVEGLTLTDEQASELEAWLSGMRAAPDAWAFRTRCQNCHGSTWRRWDERTTEDWADITRRLARWSPYYYSEGVSAQIVAFLSAEKGVQSTDLGLGARYEAWAEVVRVCDPCHALSYELDRYAQASREDTRSMIDRMNQKLAEPLTAPELEQLTDDYIDLISEPGAFERVFPHDQPEPKGGGL